MKQDERQMRLLNLNKKKKTKVGNDFKVINGNFFIGSSPQTNVLDVVIVVSMILGNQESDLIVDINGDGGLNIQDIILLMNIILSGE